MSWTVGRLGKPMSGVGDFLEGSAVIVLGCVTAIYIKTCRIRRSGASKIEANFKKSARNPFTLSGDLASNACMEGL